MSVRRPRSTPSWRKRSWPGQSSPMVPAIASGAAMPGTSMIRTGICGRSPGIHSGRWTTEPAPGVDVGRTNRGGLPGAPRSFSRCRRGRLRLGTREAQDMNPILDLLGRRLRLAVVGGGPGSFIGPVHRTAARLDDRFEIVAGVLSSDAGRSRTAAAALGIAPDRAYDAWRAMFAGERARDDGADAVAVMTPNGSH